MAFACFSQSSFLRISFFVFHHLWGALMKCSAVKFFVIFLTTIVKEHFVKKTDLTKNKETIYKLALTCIIKWRVVTSLLAIYLYANRILRIIFHLQ